MIFPKNESGGLDIEILIGKNGNPVPNWLSGAAHRNWQFAALKCQPFNHSNGNISTCVCMYGWMDGWMG